MDIHFTENEIHTFSLTSIVARLMVRSSTSSEMGRSSLICSVEASTPIGHFLTLTYKVSSWGLIDAPITWPPHSITFSGRLRRQGLDRSSDVILSKLVDFIFQYVQTDIFETFFTFESLFGEAPKSESLWRKQGSVLCPPRPPSICYATDCFLL